jgi:hypothetical protein
MVLSWFRFKNTIQLLGIVIILSDPGFLNNNYTHSNIVFPILFITYKHKLS